MLCSLDRNSIMNFSRFWVIIFDYPVSEDSVLRCLVREVIFASISTGSCEESESVSLKLIWIIEAKLSLIVMRRQVAHIKDSY